MGKRVEREGKAGWRVNVKNPICGHDCGYVCMTKQNNEKLSLLLSLDVCFFIVRERWKKGKGKGGHGLIKRCTKKNDVGSPYYKLGCAFFISRDSWEKE